MISRSPSVRLSRPSLPLSPPAPGARPPSLPHALRFARDRLDDGRLDLANGRPPALANYNRNELLTCDLLNHRMQRRLLAMRPLATFTSV
eukprot:gene28912-32106_t